MFQTNLYVKYTDTDELQEFLDVHPDNRYEIEDGLLTFETTNGEQIFYVPADKIVMFYTKCVRVS